MMTSVPPSTFILLDSIVFNHVCTSISDAESKEQVLDTGLTVDAVVRQLSQWLEEAVPPDDGIIEH